MPHGQLLHASFTPSIEIARNAKLCQSSSDCPCTQCFSLTVALRVPRKDVAHNLCFWLVHNKGSFAIRFCKAVAVGEMSVKDHVAGLYLETPTVELNAV